MNNENVVVKKDNKGVIVLLLIVIIGLVGFIVYDKMNNNEVTNSSNKETKTSEISKKEELDYIGYYAVIARDNDKYNETKVFLALYENNAAVITDLSISPVQYVGGYSVNDNNIVVNSKWTRQDQVPNKYENVFNFNIKNNKFIINSKLMGYNYDEMFEFEKITKEKYDSEVYSVIPKSVN